MDFRTNTGMLTPHFRIRQNYLPQDWHSRKTQTSLHPHTSPLTGLDSFYYIVESRLGITFSIDKLARNSVIW